MKNSETIKNLSFTAIIVSINIVFVLLNLLSPIFTILLLIAMPFSITLVKIKCGLKYSLLGILSSILITILIDYQTSLFYLLPSLISGLLFGIFIEKKLHRFYIVIFSSLIGIFTQYLSILLINAISSIDMILLFSQIFKIDINIFKDISYVILFIISFIQTIFSYIIIDSEAEKFNIEIKKENNLFYHLLIETICLSIAGWLIHTIIPSLSYILTCTSVLCGGYLIYYLIKSHNRLLNISLILTYVITYFICLIYSSYFKNNGYDLLFNVFSITSFVNGVIFIIYVRLIKKQKITFLTFESNNVNQGE